MPTHTADDEILVRRMFSGVNASDINFTSGKYHGSSKEAERNLPFDAGFESVGIVVQAGAKSGTVSKRSTHEISRVHCFSVGNDVP